MTATSKNIELIVKQWTTFDLKTIQHDLDVTTTEIASRADESDQSRKKLVELSRDFKKSTSEDVRKAVAPILKSFQVEIDSLSKRSKAAEKAFLEIYRHLSELSDPVPALEYAQSLQRRSEKVSDLEVENQKLRETLGEYNLEFADVKNQEVTIKQLREKIKDLEEKTESSVQQRVKDKEKELQRIYGEKERQLQSQQFDLAAKYADMEMRHDQIQKVLDHARQEMFEYKSKQEDASSARSSEIDILNQDLERANERAASAERLADKLRGQLDQAQNVAASTSLNKTAEESLSQEGVERSLREKLELELASKEREVAALVIDTQKLQSTLIKVKEASLAQISDLESVLTAREKLIAQLESKLLSQADYDEIKRELTILKSIEFSSTNRSTDDQPKKSLEMLLLEKNRALQSEQTQTKMAAAELESKTNHHSCRHCSSPCAHQLNTLSSLPSPLSPSQSSVKSSSLSTFCNHTEKITQPHASPSSKVISLLMPSETLPLRCHSLSAPADVKHSTSPIMITPTAQVLPSSPAESFTGRSLPAIPWPKVSCPLAEVKPTGFLPTANNVTEPLETTHVATVVRQLLAQHNIGQRIFARYILSLSQGTVSELLSKPKTWSKLTEKSKESYRKMWAWANSEESILALKSISPRKGSKDSAYLSMPAKLASSALETLKPSRTPSSSPSASSSRAPSPPGSELLAPPTVIPAFVPSLLMQTTNRLKNEPYLSYNLLYSQPDNYRNWLMLQEIVRNNLLHGRDMLLAGEESEHDDEDDSQPTPLDLSVKGDNESISPNRPSTFKSTKTSLTPLTEQDTTKYPYIDTTELVQAVKDVLTRYNISQRYFGDKILGLSQGSVSDILARPKQWESLTQKGREPFIRMRLFLDDSNAVLQLTHAIALSSPMSINSVHANNSAFNDNSIDSLTNDGSVILSSESRSSPSLQTLNSKTAEKKKSKPRPKSTSHNSKPQIPPYDLPKIVPPATIDTEQLSAQVRELLSAYTIGQRVFGEAVLNLSQGTVSEILSKPRSWHALSIKGREPYLRMYTWFHDTDNVQKLLAWKQQRDASRQSTNSSTGDTESTPLPSHASSTVGSSRRSLFTDAQRLALKQIFENDPYPSQACLEQLVHDLSLPMNKISNWFHNARMRTKSQLQPTDLANMTVSPLSDVESDDDELPSMAPLTSAWLHESDSSHSPISSSTNLRSSSDEPKSAPSQSGSSSKKRKSVPQKLITTKKLHHENEQPSANGSS